MHYTTELNRLHTDLQCNTDDTWIVDNEVWLEKRKFTKWFSDYSQAWREILEQSDQDLGLALEGGREGGYRS